MALLAVLQIAVLSLLVLASPAASFDDYVNDLGEDVAFDCPNGEALTEFASSQGEISIRRKRSTGDFDRQFELSCTPVSFFGGLAIQLAIAHTLTSGMLPHPTDREQSEGVL